MPLSAGQGFVDLIPRINAAAFTTAANAQLAPAAAKVGDAGAKTFGQKFAAGFKKSLVPIGGILIASASIAVAKLTLDFENAFTRIAAISNASTEQITRWRDAVFELGAETAIAPQKLADGLFFLASAGLDANAIFPALEASAKAAAIGLGEMEDITRTVAQVLNAYPEAGLSAVDVIDTLTAAVRESTAEPEEFATALGRVLPIAAKASVGIDEVVASLATLSNIGLDVDEGVTGIRQVLNLIVSPGKQATETLNELGISTEKLRDRLANRGIINVLRFLNQRVGESEDKFRKLLPNIRAMTAAFGLTEQEAAKVDGIFRRVADSSGDLAQALAETQQGPGFKFRKTMVSLQEAAIRLGQAFLPIGTLIAGAFTTILGPAADLLKLLGQFPGVLTALFVGWASLKIIGLVGSLIEKVTVFATANTVALAAETAATEALAIAQLNLNAAFFKGAAAYKAAEIAVVEATAVQAEAAAATAASTGSNFGLVASLGALINPVTIAAAGIGLIAFGMYDANKRAKELTRGVDVLAHALAAGKFNELGIREGVRAAFGDVPADFEPQIDAIIRRIIVRSHDIIQAQKEQRQEIEKQGKSIATFVMPALGRGTEILRSMGTNINEFSTNAVRALRKGDEAFQKFSEGAIKDASELIQDFHDNAVENLNFTVTALQDLSSAATEAQDTLATTDFSAISAEDLADLREAADLTAGELLQSFKDARKETEAFGHDLLTITRRGGELGDRVAEVLLSMGPAGQAAADTIAQALVDTPKLGQALLTNFSAGEQAAESLATRLTRRIVGTLKSIEDILAAIAKSFGIDIDDSEVTTATRNLETLQGRMNEVDGTTATVHVTSVFHREGGELPPGFVNPIADPVGPTARGGVIGAAHGGITQRPTLLAGEGRYATPYGKGAEAIMPLDDHTVGRLGASIARAIEIPTIIVKVGEEELARTVTRGQRRHRALVGA